MTSYPTGPLPDCLEGSRTSDLCPPISLDQGRPLTPALDSKNICGCLSAGGSPRLGLYTYQDGASDWNVSETMPDNSESVYDATEIDEESEFDPPGYCSDGPNDFFGY